MYKAYVIESERGWGSKIDERHEFATEAERDKFIEDYNAANNLDHVPDMYWYAEKA